MDYHAYNPDPRPAPRETIGGGSRLIQEPIVAIANLYQNREDLELVRVIAIAEVYRGSGNVVFFTTLDPNELNPDYALELSVFKEKFEEIDR